ncbi:MAG: hypothetical protein U0105_14360 [Candidatus Obscuribacterales bacterium]
MAIAEIREFLAPLPDGALIASRQLLHLARNRSAIDMAMSRLNASHEITRVAWGLYKKGGLHAPQPSTTEIAHAKARAFHRIIAHVSAHFAMQVGLPPPDEPADTFATTGRTSRIWSLSGPIQYVGASMRKIRLADSAVGTQLRTMWHMGRHTDPTRFIENAISGWTEDNWDEYAARFHQLPKWLSDLFALPAQRPGNRHFLLE